MEFGSLRIASMKDSGRLGLEGLEGCMVTRMLMANDFKIGRIDMDIDFGVFFFVLSRYCLCLSVCVIASASSRLMRKMDRGGRPGATDVFMKDNSRTVAFLELARMVDLACFTW